MPRFLFNDFPLGNSAGKPHDPESQIATLEQALRVLETIAGLKLSEVTEIRRQSGEYKSAVALLSEGRTAQGLDKLDALVQAERLRLKTEEK